MHLRRLLPAGDPVAVAEVTDELYRRSLPARTPPRPYVMLNMVSTTDGRASVGGRSGSIAGRADRELFHGLRGIVDGVLVGAGTVRAEHYGRIIREEPLRRLRAERGQSPEPLACIVSARLSLPGDIPLLGEPGARVAIITTSAASLPAGAADIDYVRAGREGELDLPGALAELAERFSVGTLLCEGGPHLNLQLLAAGLVDELFLSFSPLLAGGDTATGDGLRILAGAELQPPVELELLSVLESDSQLFLHYRVGSPAAPARV